ncbi:hypothetical protein HD597_001534 [Nonomuraea thailandensis]|uniref:Uncharacterized protein n=1 Tax=Nonomuraea thailandensis TaxID=1188745 RepID=A0A9X2GBW6_9ACTN|nr:hypothetical protein [Nonomuraea thailandensis]MCP2354514.1 hypothetical protein [Nonomuraea thailandensis]
MRRRAQLLLATAALTTGLVTALAPVATAGRPAGLDPVPGVTGTTQAVRHALMQTGRHFYFLSDIIGGINWHNQLTL